MKIKILQCIASSEGWAYGAGQIVDIDDAVAAKWIDGGIAEGVTGDEGNGGMPVLEAAIREAPEKAILPIAKQKTKGGNK